MNWHRISGNFTGAKIFLFHFLIQYNLIETARLILENQVHPGCLPTLATKTGAVREKGLAKKTQMQVGYKIAGIPWLVWQVLRRSPKYRKAVAHLLHLWRKDSKLGKWEPELEDNEREWRLHRVQAVQAMLRAYIVLRFGEMKPPIEQADAKIEWGELDPLDVEQLERTRVVPRRRGDRKRGNYQAQVFRAGERPKPHGAGRFEGSDDRSMAELERIVSEGLRARWYTPAVGKSAVEVITSKKRRDALPELKNFTHRWKMCFPVLPSIKVQLENFMTSHWVRPVKIRQLTSDDHLVLEIRPEIGKEIVLAYIGGALWHSLPKRRDGSMLASRKQGVRRKVKIVKKSKYRLLAEISLPANKEDVLRKLGKHLTIHSPHFKLAGDEKPDEMTSLDRNYYVLVFNAIDLRKRGLKLAEIAARLWPGLQKDARSVYDLERAFSELANRFGIPL